jgi:hypothetical protein
VCGVEQDGGWSKGYNADIVWDDGDAPAAVDDSNARVVSFVDAETDGAVDGNGYWYSYGNFAGACASF